MFTGLLARMGMACTVALVAMLVPGPAQGASAQSQRATYFFQSTSTIFGADGSTGYYHISGDATCRANCHPPNPAHGTFSIDFSGVFHPPSPCRVTNASGALTAQWTTSSGTTTAAATTTSTAKIKAAFYASQDEEEPHQQRLWLAMSGKFPAGDPIFPAGPVYALLQASHPPDPCHSAYPGYFSLG